MQENKKHYNISVYGKVQGVFFRAETQKQAERLGITGYVSNQEDGSVYIEAEGKEEELNRLLEWAKEGSRLAKVENISFDEGKVKEFEEFSIEY